jgi:hypothetical protein
MTFTEAVDAILAEYQKDPDIPGAGNWRPSGWDRIVAAAKRLDNAALSNVAADSRSRDRVLVVQSPISEQWSWHRFSANNEQLCWSGETYVNLDHCLEMAKGINSGLDNDRFEIERIG